MGQTREFEGKVVVVTGGAGGLGRALCERFGRAGARIAVLDINGAAAEDFAAELAENEVESLGLCCDVRDARSCAAGMAAVQARFGGIDALINNAGISHRSAFVDTDLAVLRRVIEINLMGSIHATHAAAPALVEARGLIIALSSVAGFAPLWGRTAYAASKHGLHGFFDTLRAELRPQGVDVLLVCPSFVRTGIAAASLDAKGQPLGHDQETVGEVAEPAEIAEAIFAAAAKGKELLLPSRTGRMARLVCKLSPRLFERLMMRGVRAEFDEA